MKTHLEIKGDDKVLHVSANGADMVIDHQHPMDIEIRLVVDHLVRSASRNVRKTAADNLTLDDLIFAARERLEQLENYKQQQQTGGGAEVD